MKILFTVLCLLAMLGGEQLKAQSAKSKRDSSAIDVKTRFVKVNGYRIAHRVIGSGEPIILCNRFRGTLDSYDPAFIDQLAKFYRVIIFDYNGVGRSDGEFPITMKAVAGQVKDFATALGLKKFVIAGWSTGGMVSQILAVDYPSLITHVVLLGTNPPGGGPHKIEQVFLDRAWKPVNDLEDETVLFFEPASDFSRKAAKASHDRIAARKTDLDLPAAEKMWPNNFKSVDSFYADADNVRQRLAKLNVPVLMVGGDHDSATSVENWFELNRKFPNVQLVVFPQAGHGPQHQYPELAANYILNFLKYSPRPN